MDEIRLGHEAGQKLFGEAVSGALALTDKPWSVLAPEFCALYNRCAAPVTLGMHPLHLLEGTAGDLTMWPDVLQLGPRLCEGCWPCYQPSPAQQAPSAGPTQCPGRGHPAAGWHRWACHDRVPPRGLSPCVQDTPSTGWHRTGCQYSLLGNNHAVISCKPPCLPLCTGPLCSSKCSGRCCMPLELISSMVAPLR